MLKKKYCLRRQKSRGTSRTSKQTIPPKICNTSEREESQLEPVRKGHLLKRRHHTGALNARGTTDGKKKGRSRGRSKTLRWLRADAGMVTLQRKQRQRSQCRSNGKTKEVKKKPGNVHRELQGGKYIKSAESSSWMTVLDPKSRGGRSNLNFNGG